MFWEADGAGIFCSCLEASCCSGALSAIDGILSCTDDAERVEISSKVCQLRAYARPLTGAVGGGCNFQRRRRLVGLTFPGQVC